ncbi:uncharacterized protein LOC124690284 [Lolium rigidum]|uniref:uncharacterized protein LOC124690284 n=1 Tax=Lolium rigidum TaxID=89674 RepID=UPI001F5CCF72|nr:uncharacterized protein LOC124690284 [Lolium rigidum]
MSAAATVAPVPAVARARLQLGRRCRASPPSTGWARSSSPEKRASTLNAWESPDNRDAPNVVETPGNRGRLACRGSAAESGLPSTSWKRCGSEAAFHAGTPTTPARHSTTSLPVAALSSGTYNTPRHFLLLTMVEIASSTSLSWHSLRIEEDARPRLCLALCEHAKVNGEREVVCAPRCSASGTCAD